MTVPVHYHLTSFNLSSWQCRYVKCKYGTGRVLYGGDHCMGYVPRGNPTLLYFKCGLSWGTKVWGSKAWPSLLPFESEIQEMVDRLGSVCVVLDD
jgi:hypothetical protein